jgi:hypothetical protein
VFIRKFPLLLVDVGQIAGMIKRRSIGSAIAQIPRSRERNRVAAKRYFA